MNFTPTVIEKVPGGGERAYDIYSRLLKERIIWLSGAVNEGTAAQICSQMLFLEKEDPKKSIDLYINSPGGIVTEGLAIYDCMNFVACPVSTMVIGQACSMGSLLATNGEKGMRYILPSSRVMIHQPSGGAQGQATDIEIQAREILKLRAYLNGLYVTNTGQQLDVIEKAMERDNFMSAQEAVDFGLVDSIVTKRT